MKKFLSIGSKIMFVIAWITYNTLVWSYNTALVRFIWGLVFLIGPTLMMRQNCSQVCLVPLLFGSVGLVLIFSAGLAPNQFDPNVDYGSGIKVEFLSYSDSPGALRKILIQNVKKIRRTLVLKVRGIINAIKN